MQFAQGKNPTCVTCFSMGNISNFAIVKSLRKFGGCLVDSNTLSFWKQVLSYLLLILPR